MANERLTDREDNARLAAIVESSNEAVIGNDLNGLVFAWNGAAERLFGYTASEMIGQPLTVIFAPDRLDEEALILGQIARGERVEQYETTRRCKDGQIIKILATVSPIKDAEGRIIGASEIVRDLADRDTAHERRIQELQSELAHVQRLTELGQVVSTLVHEINQPMSAIRNYLNACRRLVVAGNEKGIQTALDRMEAQAKRTSQIVQRIRDFVKKRDVQMRPEKLALVIDEAIALTGSSLGDNSTTLTVQVDPTEPLARIDRVQVEQVLFNLMRNGIEAMQDQPRRELVVSTRRAPGGMVEISVADTGPGLPQQVRERLFQPFVTTKPHGMGVGLSVCQGIVKLHGGRMWADDNIAGGTVFRFTVRSADPQVPNVALELPSGG
jgi:two-component system sensor kinase FixL